MQIVIEIPEEEHEEIINSEDCGLHRLTRAVANGIPLTNILTKIKVEIDGIEEGISNYSNDRPWLFKDEVLDIIDKYRESTE